MGCGSSKNKINVVSGLVTIDNTKVDPTNTKIKTQSSTVSQKRQQSGVSRKSGNSAWGSQSSLGDDRSIRSADLRGGSATSKVSKRSGDSGFDDQGYKNVITESSDPDKIRTIEEEFKSPRGLELGVVGQAVPQRLSAKDKDRLQEQRILATLQQEGLITRPMSRAGAGVRFDIVSIEQGENAFVAARPPARLAKLEKRRKKKKMTEEEIEAKLARAEERRKELEQQRLAKIQAVTMKSDVQNALDTFAQRQETIDTKIKSKEEQAMENREAKLREMRDKLRAKEARAAEVRKRKMLAPMQVEGEDDQVMQSQKFSEDTPVGVSLKSSDE